MFQPIADNQKLHFQLHIVPDDLIESLLTNIYFRSFKFSDQYRVAPSIENHQIGPLGIIVHFKACFNSD